MKSEVPQRILAIDVGGTHVKIRVSHRREVRQAKSGHKLTAARMVTQVREMADHWTFDLVSIGYPGVVVDGSIVCEPENLGRGWVGFDFCKAFGCPVQVINDAAMQAMGSYRGGRMLFLGLGTGIGVVLMDGLIIHPMELAHLPFMKRGTFGTYAGDCARRRLGVTVWRKRVVRIVRAMSDILNADYVVIGGGNARRLKRIPRYARLGDNNFAFLGGFRAWRRSVGTKKTRRP